MDILLNVKSNWAKIKGGFSKGNLFSSGVPAQPKRTFVDGISAEFKAATGTTMKQVDGAFGGKTYNKRK